MLASLHRAGELAPVYVPREEDEAMRDLVRARQDAVKAGRVSKQQLKGFLLRQSKALGCVRNYIQDHKSNSSNPTIQRMAGFTVFRVKNQADMVLVGKYPA